MVHMVWYVWFGICDMYGMVFMHLMICKQSVYGVVWDYIILYDVETWYGKERKLQDLNMCLDMIWYDDHCILWYGLI